MNIELARHNMIENQIRPWNVFDMPILDLLSNTPREEFIPDPYKKFAFIDMATPIGMEQVMMLPKEEGRILQSLQIKPEETVLEIGTGSGYLTALLAKQAKEVDSVEIIPELGLQALTILKNHHLLNITITIGDGSKGWKRGKQYDVIVITGSLPSLPKEFHQNLNPHGRIFAILGSPPTMKAVLITQDQHHQWQQKLLFNTNTPRLQNASETYHFKL